MLAEFQARNLRRHLEMQRTINQLSLLQEAEDRYNEIPRWRIFRRRFAKEVWRSTILMVANGPDGLPKLSNPKAFGEQNETHGNESEKVTKEKNTNGYLIS